MSSTEAVPATGEDFALVLPRVCTQAMDRFLADFAASVPPDTLAVMVLDGAGRHHPRAVTLPPNLALVPLTPYSPELNPVERVWLSLRERSLSHRLLADYEAVVEARCRAWNALAAETGRIKSLCAYPYLEQISSQARRYHTGAGSTDVPPSGSGAARRPEPGPELSARPGPTSLRFPGASPA
ncbi:transposase [Methylobacterium sp. CB376]|nr:transposase [Methylobacterium nodulans]WFT83740.1 transposase [Methylobacterium nodulans]